MNPRGTLSVYHYDVNGVYTHTELITGWPQGNGDVIYRVPINATFENPWWQEGTVGRVPVFDEKMRVWHHIADHRGETWYDNRDNAVLVRRIGNPADWGWRKEPRMMGAYGNGR